MPLFLLLTQLLLTPLLLLASPRAQATPTHFFIPALTRFDQAEYLGPPATSGLNYLTQDNSFEGPATTAPLIPFQAWGLKCEQDWLVSLANDAGWGMIEIIQVRSPSGKPTWFTLDSRLDGTQFVGLPTGDQDARQLAALFPAQPYEANLQVVQSSSGIDQTISVQYQRIDGATIQFTMTANGTPLPRSLRNGHGMNHSERNTLAVIDLESFQLAKNRIVFQNDALAPRRTAQRIAGVQIAGLLLQTVGGLSRGRWSQSEAQVDGKTVATLALNPLFDRSEKITRSFEWREDLSQAQGTLTENNGFQQTEYLFDILKPVPGQATIQANELREIRISQISLAAGTQSPPERSETLRVRFNPSLPDFRYAIAPEKLKPTRFTVSVAGQPAYSKGTLFVEKGNEPPQGDIQLKLVAEWPSWARERPMLTHIKKQGPRASVEANVLVPGALRESRSVVQGRKHKGLFKALQSFDFSWEKRPHRLSSLIVRLPGTLSEQDAGEFKLGGGTWANGEAASDQALAAIGTGEIRGGQFTIASTPFFPLVQAARQSQKLAEVEGIHRVEIQLPPRRLGLKRTAFIQGFEFKAGPLHESDGLTLSGFGLEILEATETRDRLILKVKMTQAFRAVPDRLQDFENYSALGRLHLAVLESDDTHAEEGHLFTAKGVEPRLFFPGADGLEARCMQEEQRALKPFLFEAITFQIEDLSRFGGRYTRKIRATAAPTNSTERFSNAGEVSRETPWTLSKVLLELPGLDWGSQMPLECIKSP